MDSAGDFDIVFDSAGGGVLKSEDQRGGLTIASGVASTGLSGLAGD